MRGCMQSNIRFEPSTDDPDVAYVAMPDKPIDPSPGIVKRSIDLASLVDNYKGPQILLDFDATNTLIGIEIIA